MKLHLIPPILITVLISSCQAQTDPPVLDPHRAEMITACKDQPSYRTRDQDRVLKHCGCIYDKTMQDLTDAERHVARFYLLGQSGVDVESRPEFKTMDLDSMMPASRAIGEAVKLCRRP